VRIPASTLAIVALTVLAGAALAQVRPQLHPRMPGLQTPEPVESDVEADIIDRTNAFRAQQGQGGLQENPALTAEARDFAAYLARTGAFSHDADGRGPGLRAQRAGYDYCEVAENLAYEEDSAGFRGRDVAGDLMRGWERSEGHRRNLLDPSVVETGVGVARAPGRTPRYVAVQEFGRPASLRFAFEVTNRTGLRLSYAFEGRTRSIEPGMTVTHWPCGPASLRVRAPGPAGSAPIVVEPGKVYVLEPAPGFGVKIEVRRHA
jgi:uncharacterized protein YkwD